VIKKSFSSLFVFSLILIGFFGFSHKVHAAPCVGNLGANTSTTVSSPTGSIQLSWDSTNCTTLFLEGVGSYSYQSVRSPVGSRNIPYDASGGTQTFYLYGTDPNTNNTQSIASVTITYVAPQPATLTVNVVDENNSPLSGASWSVSGGSPTASPSSGSGTSASHTVYPSSGGDSITAFNFSAISGLQSPTFQNSDFTTSQTVMMFPGNSKSITAKYGIISVPDCTISLSANTNSIVNGNSVTLTWTSTNTINPFSSGTNFSTGNSPANTIGVSASPTVTTTYTITGYGGKGCFSSQTITVTIAPPPPTPTINSFTATASCSGQTPQIILSWSGSNVTGYTVQRNNSGGATIYSGAGTSYTDSGRTTGQTYSYYLVATGPGGNVNQTASATASNCTLPAPPVMISVTATPACNVTTPQMGLTWSASNSPTSYTVKRNNSSGATVYSGSATSFTDPSLTASTLYTYYVTATNADGTSAGMTGSNITLSCAGGSAPTVTVTPMPGTISTGNPSMINWDLSGGSASVCNLSAIPANPQWSGSVSGLDVTPGGHARQVNNITVTTTFSMSCNGPGGTGSGSGVVTVSAGGSPVVSISANPTSVTSGNSSNLTWSVTGNPTPTCTASGGWGGTQNTIGTNVSTGALFGNTTFTLSCANAGGTVANSASVSVTGGGGADLRGGIITTNTFTVTGSDAVIGGQIINAGASAIASQFPYVMQITNAPNGGGSLLSMPSAPVQSGFLPGTVVGYLRYTFPATGMYSARMCVDGTAVIGLGPNPILVGGNISEADKSNNCGPWGNITVTSGTIDVLAGPTYTTTPAGVSNMQWWWYFGAYIKNQGTSATPGSGFPSIGQLATQTNGGGTITDFSASATIPIAAGAQVGSSFGSGYVFAVPGTYSTRVCADATGVSGNTAIGGILVETDESNNCGPWTDLVVTNDATTNTTAYINVFSNMPSSWDIVPWPGSGQTVNPSSGSGTQSNHTASGGGWAYTLNNIQAISGYTYTVIPSSVQNIFNGRTTSYWINYTSTGGFNYTLSSGGNVTITKSAIPVGVPATISKTITSGSSQAVDITATGMPAGVSIAYANRTCSPTCNSTINFTVDPSTTAGTYPITVTSSTAGLADKTTSFNLVISNPVVLGVTCTPSPSPALVGQPVTWTGTVVGGTAPYTYAWSGTDMTAGITNPYVFTYQSTGVKTATLRVTDSFSATGTCAPANLSVTIDPRYKEF